MTQQTAVEWLVNQLTEVEFNLINKNFLWQYKTNSMASHILKKIFEQAKAMEKERTEDTYWDAYKEGQCSSDKTAEEYYNETFNKEEQNNNNPENHQE